MKPTIRRKLEALVERREEVGRLLGDPAVGADPARFRDLSREYAQLEPVALALAAHDAALRELAAARALGDDGDPELAAHATHVHLHHALASILASIAGEATTATSNANLTKGPQ